MSSAQDLLENQKLLRLNSCISIANKNAYSVLYQQWYSFCHLNCRAFNWPWAFGCDCICQLNLDPESGQKHSLISMMKIFKDIIEKDAAVHISQIFEIDCLGDQELGHVTVTFVRMLVQHDREIKQSTLSRFLVSIIIKLSQSMYSGVQQI